MNSHTTKVRKTSRKGIELRSRDFFARVRMSLLSMELIKIENTQYTCQEKYSQPKGQVMYVEGGFKTTVWALPSGNYRIVQTGNVAEIDTEPGACKEGSHCSAQQDGAKSTIDEKEYFVGPVSENITGFRPEFIGYSLNDKAEQDDNPYPVCPAETCGIKQGKGSKESAAKCNQRGKGELPFSAQGIHQNGTFSFGFSQCIQKCLSPLNKNRNTRIEPSREMMAHQYCCNAKYDNDSNILISSLFRSDFDLFEHNTQFCDQQGGKKYCKKPECYLNRGGIDMGDGCHGG